MVLVVVVVVITVGLRKTLLRVFGFITVHTHFRY